ARARWTEVPSERVDEATALAGGGVIAVGGGSAIDLGKAISAVADVPLVSVPTTYSGAEWTTFYGIRDLERKMRGGGAGAHPAGIVYDAELTLDLPRETTVGTAMNALAHCADALYAVQRFREAVGRDVAELTALGGITRLRELGVPEEDLPELAAAAAARPGNQANPRPATPDEIEQLLRSVW